MKWLANMEGGGKNTQSDLLKQISNGGSLVFNDVIIGEVRITILSPGSKFGILPPKETLLDREK